MTKFIVGFLLVSMSFAAFADEIVPTILKSSAEVEAHYCRTTYNKKLGCDGPHAKVAVFRFPADKAKWVTDLAAESIRRGYAKDFSLEDLFHGHLILKGPNSLYP